MGVSLSVFKIQDYKKENLIGNNEIDTLNGQLTFYDLELMDELGSAKSILKLVDYNEETERATYKATHFSETIKHPVRVFFPEYEDIQEEHVKIERGSKVLENGYQQVFVFEVIIDFKTEEIFILTKRAVALSFMKRFRHSKKLDFGIIEFDLAKIDEIVELNNVWGLWEDSEGRCKKKAYFGTEVHKVDGVDNEKITSYNITYEHDGNDVDLIICRESRLSSRSSLIANVDLVRIYENLKVELKKNGRT